jgi:peroxiredoxin
MRNLVIVVGMAVALVSGCIVPAPIPADQIAPPFKGQGVDQEHYSLLDLALKGPVLVIFIPKSCVSANPRLVFSNLLAKAYKGKVSALGVYGGSEKELSDWSMEVDSDFPWIPDPGLLIAEKYGFESGPVAMVISQRGKIEGRWTKWDRTEITAINEMLAKLTNQPLAKIDVASAPATSVAPCMYALPQRDFSKP